MPRKPRSALAVKRHVFIRQVAIFGVIAAVLAVVGVVAAGAYTGRLTIGFISHPFSSPTPSATDYGPTPCPASDDAKYPANAKITVRVLNASTITGAAGSVGQTLQARGFKVDSVASISEDFQGSILVRAGYKGIDAAYMVLTHMPDDAKLTVDDRDTSVVDVIIGAKYNGIRPASEVAVSAGDRIAPAPGCVPLTQAMADIGVSIAPSPSPSAATKKTKKSGTATPTAPSTGY